MSASWMLDSATQADYAEEPAEAPCERCGAAPAYLFDHTPLAEAGTWERLCNACMDKILEPWQGPTCDCPHDEREACACDEHCAEYGACEGL